MFKQLLRLSISLIIIACSANMALAASGDLYIDNSSLYLSSEEIIEGSPIRIYLNVNNASGSDLQGLVRFYLDNTGTQIGSDQTVSVLAKNSDIAFVDLYPPAGSHTIIAKVIPWDSSADNPDNNVSRRQLWVLTDFDRDKIPDEQDDDDDNDGVLDVDDAFPKDSSESVDSDGDQIGNNADPDDDNDSVLDEADALPLNALETKDSDGDNVGDNEDLDDDNDLLEDNLELELGTDPLNPDSDEDGVLDGTDDFPLNPDEQLDTDKDGVGNIEDQDDDNDGYLDEVDPMPLNHGPIINFQGPSFPIAGIPVRLSLLESTDPDGSIKRYKWQISDETFSKPQITYEFSGSGKQEIVLEVYDDQGEGRKRTVSLFIIPGWLLPAVSILALLMIIFLSPYLKKTIFRVKEAESSEIG